MAYKRKNTRLRIESQGDLAREGKLIACQVLDMAEHGLLIRPPFPLTIGEELPFEFSVGKSRRIRCTIKVVRVAKASDFGVQIVQIAPDDRQYFTEYLDDFVVNNFGRT